MLRKTTNNSYCKNSRIYKCVLETSKFVITNSPPGQLPSPPVLHNVPVLTGICSLGSVSGAAESRGPSLHPGPQHVHVRHRAHRHHRPARPPHPRCPRDHLQVLRQTVQEGVGLDGER